LSVKKARSDYTGIVGASVVFVVLGQIEESVGGDGFGVVVLRGVKRGNQSSAMVYWTLTKDVCVDWWGQQGSVN